MINGENIETEGSCRSGDHRGKGKREGSSLGFVEQLGGDGAANPLSGRPHHLARFNTSRLIGDKRVGAASSQRVMPVEFCDRLQPTMPFHAQLRQQRVTA